MKKRRPPWGEIFDGPIERLFSIDHPKYGEMAQSDATVELVRRLSRVKEEHYGINGDTGRAWLEFALKLGAELDKALTITEPKPKPSGKTARKWAGVEGILLIENVNATWEAQCREQRKAGKPENEVTLESVFTELKDLGRSRYGEMSIDELRARLHDAEKYHPEHTKQRKK